MLRVFILLSGTIGLVLNQYNHHHDSFKTSQTHQPLDSVIVIQSGSNSLNPYIIMIDSIGSPSVTSLSLPWPSKIIHTKPDKGDLINGFGLNDSINYILATINKQTRRLRIFSIGKNPYDITELELNNSYSSLTDIYACRLTNENSDTHFFAFLLGRSGKVEQWSITAINHKTINIEFIGFMRTET